MKYWLAIFCLLFSCTKPIVQEVNLIPKPQKLEVTDGVFSLSFNTNLIVDILLLVGIPFIVNFIILKAKK